MRWPRAKTRAGIENSEHRPAVRPYYIEYRLIDLDVREVVAEFGTLFSKHADTQTASWMWQPVSAATNWIARIL